MADIATIFDWLAFLAIGLIAVTIPTYAISVSFLGREAKRALVQLQSRTEALEKKTMELSGRVGTEPGLSALKAEIATYEKDIGRIKSRLTSLSVSGAFVYPFLCFTVALVCAGYGFGVFTSTISSFSPSLTAEFWGGLSGGFSGLGILFLGNTLFRVNQAALSPETLSSFRVSFENGSTVETFAVSQPVSQQALPPPVPVKLIIHNYGKEMAEDVMVMIFFPLEFAIQPGGGLYTAGVQPHYPSADYPGYQSVTFRPDAMHEDTFYTFSINLTMPSQPGKWQVPIHVWEKRLGKSKYELTFEVA